MNRLNDYALHIRPGLMLHDAAKIIVAVRCNHGFYLKHRTSACSMSFGKIADAKKNWNGNRRVME